MDKAHQFYIAGRWVDPHGTGRAEIVDPSTEEPFATIAMGNARDAEDAILAARAAFPAWAATPLAERIALLRRIVTILERRNDEIGAMISREMGAPLRMACSDQAGIGLYHFKETIRAAETFAFDYMQGTTRICHEPIGVVSMITPWNWPINQIACKVAPALVSGCTMVLKPSEIAPLNALLFAAVLEEAGVPPGVFNLINGDGAVIGAVLSSHPLVDMVSFTGSTRAGVSVAEAAAPTVKRVHQELGGKSPDIILPSADLAQAVTAGVRSCFGNSGQSCNAPTRMLVPAARMSDAAKIAHTAAASLMIGPPADPGTDLGPVASGAHFGKIQSLILKAIEEGAELVTGGPGRPDHMAKGWYVRPTVFANVTNDMTIAREEVFGPVLVLIGYGSVGEAIRIANDTPYGLAAYVQGDHEAAVEVARHLRAGTVRLNHTPWDGAAPFGGYGQSGNGREYGVFGLKEFTEIKGIVGYQTTGP